MKGSNIESKDFLFFFFNFWKYLLVSYFSNRLVLRLNLSLLVFNFQKMEKICYLKFLIIINSIIRLLYNYIICDWKMKLTKLI